MPIIKTFRESQQLEDFEELNTKQSSALFSASDLRVETSNLTVEHKEVEEVSGLNRLVFSAWRKYLPSFKFKRTNKR